MSGPVNPIHRHLTAAEKIAGMKKHLQKWLSDNPGVTNSIIWEDYRGNVPYVSWTSAEKSDLEDAFVMVQNSNLSATPNLAYNQDPQDDVKTVLSPQTAWQYFIAYVAMSLHVQIYQGVPWSILNYNTEQLAVLFDSKSFFRFNIFTRDYVIDFDQGSVTPGDPARTQSFLKNNNIIQSDQRLTTVSLLAWCRDNLAHFGGNDSSQNANDIWQYSGMPPVEKIISGTTMISISLFEHWTAGCWGTTGFLKAVLRTVNIPVTLESRCGHAMPHFLLDDTFLSHGDDPYCRLTKSIHPPISMDQLLIDRTTLDVWLPLAIISRFPWANCQNVGRRVIELSIQYLPNYLLFHYCQDIAQGKSHADGYVFKEIFQKSGYSISDLDNANLWNNMDAKITSLGGCTNITET